ncbi:hypothetical protein OLX08_08700 [Nereida ignava]|uniref:hypothetical protein n=1 Tax=Nereida ignava TaxID=282199 RepID=UPI00399AA303
MPNHGPSHLHLGTLYTKGGKPDAAVTHLAAAAKQMPKEPAVHMQYGVALGAVGQYKKRCPPLVKQKSLPRLPLLCWPIRRMCIN